MHSDPPTGSNSFHCNGDDQIPRSDQTVGDDLSEHVSENTERTSESVHHPVGDEMGLETVENVVHSESELNEG